MRVLAIKSATAPQAANPARVLMVVVAVIRIMACAPQQEFMTG